MRFLITGATGYIGKHLLARLLRSGHQAVVMVRGRADHRRARIEAALAPFALDAAWLRDPPLEVIGGDLTRRRCGLDAGALARVRRAGVDAFIHCAGLTRFDAHLAAELLRHNLEGTRNAHGLCRELGIPQFHHLSTAFVAGTASQPFGADDRAVGQAFNNPYEHSKFAAEEFLAVARTTAGPVITIHRPSIVVGGHTLGENHGVSTVYTFLKAMHFLRACCDREMRRGRNAFAHLGVTICGDDYHLPIRIAAAPAVRIHLVSIDTVVDTVIAATRCAAPAPAPPVRAIVGQDFSLTELRAAFCPVLRITGLRFVAPGDFDQQPRNRLEELLHRLTRVYAPYLLRAPALIPDHARRCQAIDPRAIAADFLRQLEGQPHGRARPSVSALALATLGVHVPRDYFDRLVGGEIGTLLLQRIGYVDTRIRFRIDGPSPFDEVIHFDHGVARYVPDRGAPADCGYVLEHTVFLEIIAGTLDLKAAFFQGRVRIEGNQETALKFGTLLGTYYRNLDEQVVAEVEQ